MNNNVLVCKHVQIAKRALVGVCYVEYTRNQDLQELLHTSY